jgi:hypothetical protein
MKRGAVSISLGIVRTFLNYARLRTAASLARVEATLSFTDFEYFWTEADSSVV